ncbi:hypothetical protein BDY19DRAFT_989563 [Irpex rosettiformis]|uniref:Uncharacterized protein n=1 Tax=Irpex rosettiformis TaxID=378272 RepID=A0ACB8UI47_9APHY|nr:hypothetical protein BDY19DRAFT_989563 [Irpex rosettiformis]
MSSVFTCIFEAARKLGSNPIVPSTSRNTGNATQYSLGAAYEPLATVAPEQVEPLQIAEGPEMGFDEQYEKPEGREGDALAQVVAFASIGTFLIVTWAMTFASGTSFQWFGWHPLFESLGVALFSYGILTLQPTSQARTKAAGLTRHQLAMIVLGFPIIFLAYLSIYATKVTNDRAHFTSWHGKFGLLTFILLLVQVILGGGSVWFNGVLFGGNPRAKLAWKYHRAVGYATFTSLLVTLHLGGAWSNFANENAGFIVRFLAYTFAPIGLIVAVYSRIRLSKMKFF